MRPISVRRADGILHRAANAVAVALAIGLLAVIMTLIGWFGS